jgi:tetratricopeptide (TPR) repeat protein
MSPWVRHSRAIFPLIMIGLCSGLYFAWDTSREPLTMGQFSPTEIADEPPVLPLGQTTGDDFSRDISRDISHGDSHGDSQVAAIRGSLPMPAASTRRADDGGRHLPLLIDLSAVGRETDRPSGGPEQPAEAWAKAAQQASVSVAQADRSGLPQSGPYPSTGRIDYQTALGPPNRPTDRQPMGTLSVSSRSEPEQRSEGRFNPLAVPREWENDASNATAMSANRIPANLSANPNWAQVDQVAAEGNHGTVANHGRSVLEIVDPATLNRPTLGVSDAVSEVGPMRQQTLMISDQVLQLVSEHLEYGNSLARRSAVQLAKQEFYKGLATLTEAIDQASGSTAYSEALRQGFIALDETADFQSAHELRPVDLSIIVQRHATPIIRQGYLQTSSHAQARQAYLLYAKQRLAAAVGDHPLAGELLFPLGKLHLVNFEQGEKVDNLELLKAEALFEAALVAHPNHAKTNNELAVLKAKQGNWALARDLLQRAVAVENGFLEAWQNLVKVHQRLNEVELAVAAQRQVDRLMPGRLEDDGVRMVSNAEFAATESALASNDEPRVPNRPRSDVPAAATRPFGPVPRPSLNPSNSSAGPAVAPFGARSAFGR